MPETFFKAEHVVAYIIWLKLSVFADIYESHQHKRIFISVIITRKNIPFFLITIIKDYSFRLTHFTKLRKILLLCSFDPWFISERSVKKFEKNIFVFRGLFFSLRITLSCFLITLRNCSHNRQRYRITIQVSANTRLR